MNVLVRPMINVHGIVPGYHVAWRLPTDFAMVLDRAKELLREDFDLSEIRSPLAGWSEPILFTAGNDFAATFQGEFGDADLPFALRLRLCDLFPPEPLPPSLNPYDVQPCNPAYHIEAIWRKTQERHQDAVTFTFEGRWLLPDQTGKLVRHQMEMLEVSPDELSSFDNPPF